jgi:hypothetical protein
MSGSKKGERRGAARKRITDTAPVRPKRQMLPQKATEDYMRQIAMVVSDIAPGSQRLPPREMMWEAQGWFHDEARGFQRIVTDLLAKLIDAKDEKEWHELEVRLAWAKAKVGEMLLTAVDVAFKAAPYYHSKLSAEKTGGTDYGSPLEILRILMQEIDEATRGRPTWMKQELKLISSN